MQSVILRQEGCCQGVSNKNIQGYEKTDCYLVTMDRRKSQNIVLLSMTVFLGQLWENKAFQMLWEPPSYWRRMKGRI